MPVVKAGYWAGRHLNKTHDIRGQMEDQRELSRTFPGCERKAWDKRRRRRRNEV